MFFQNQVVCADAEMVTGEWWTLLKDYYWNGEYISV